MDLLKGIKIVDLTRLLPGPLATHLLAQMGAEVIKIESPKRRDYVGEGLKKVDGATHLFHQLNHNKKRRIIDYNTDEGRGELLDLIRDADALLEQFRPGAMGAWGLGYEEIRKLNPGIVYVSLTGYGQEGEYRNDAGHDFNYLAYAGIMSLLKNDEGKPIVPDTQFADIGGAYMAVMATQAALLKKEKSGEGSFVDVAMCSSVMPFLAVPYSLYAAGYNYRQINVINGKVAVNYSVYECSDGKWLSIAALEVKFWNNLCDVIDKPDWKRLNQLELFNNIFPRVEVDQLFKTRSREEWIETFKGHDVCVAPVLEIEELEDHPYHRQRQSFQLFETSNGTELKTIQLPFRVYEK